MGYHWEKLLQHLDHIVEQLEQGLKYLQQCDPSLDGYNIGLRQGQYRQLKEVLLEVDREAVDLLVGECSGLVILLGLLNYGGQMKVITQCLCVQFLSYFCSCVWNIFYNLP